MKISILEYVQQEIEEQERDAKKSQDKLNENFLYNFEWSYSESLFKSLYIKAYLNDFVTFINKDPERGMEWIKFNIQRLTSDLLRGSVQNNSTSAYSNLVHTYKRECAQYLLELFERYFLWIEEKETPILNNTLSLNS